MIPRRIFRTIPADPSDEVEGLWRKACALNPTFEAVTYRDPIDPTRFPVTAPLWSRCTSGAQRAGLIRLEVLAADGGIYLDSDVELYRPLDELLVLRAFAGYEDPGVVPDAVLGAEAGHPAIVECLRRAVELVAAGAGAHASGPSVTTAVLPGRSDVVCFPPGSWYPYHYSERHRRREDHQQGNPWAYGAHHWAGSWLPESERT